MTDSQRLVLDKLKEHAIAGDTSYPAYSHPHTGISDLRRSFQSVIESVGGECRFVADLEAARKYVSGSEVLVSAKQVCSYVKEVADGNFDAEALADAHQCADVDLTIVRGEFGIAENGAVWVNADPLRHRALLFLSGNLILVVEGRDIVPDMESAYARIDFSRLRSGYFVSGPSKTADIEQCLVIGAHGAKSLLVLVVGYPLSPS
jgi:L-lactate dehydrogenase complex protein LldG